MNFVKSCRTGVLRSAQLETQMTSVERIVEYTELPPELPLESDEKSAPPANWPQQGHIEFKSLNLRYDKNGPRSLCNITFRIEAKQKIGVVGRTGAGKSSLVQSLFRLAENEGEILIDGIDIGTIGLNDLRKRITIIPQDAVLFSKSLRFNLDPFGERTDTEIWDSLDQVELKSVISAMPGGIDTLVLDGGSNFSIGQRQLICLARAILRNNKILILDEATANVDSDTDKLIHQTIRSRFTDYTVITIAHRLQTVVECDKVLVIDAGEIKEFDHPYELIERQDSFFKGLLDQMGSATATALTLIAKANYERKEENRKDR